MVILIQDCIIYPHAVSWATHYWMSRHYDLFSILGHDIVSFMPDQMNIIYLGDLK